MAKKSLQEELKDYDAMFIALKDLLDEIPSEISSKRPQPNKWSIKELMCHLVDTELNFILRMKKIISEDKPALMPYDPEKWAKRLKYDTWDMKEAVLLFGLNRSAMSKILNNLPATAWRRTGSHEELGTVSLQFLLEDSNHHCKHHLAQIMAIKMKYMPTKQ